MDFRDFSDCSDFFWKMLIFKLLYLCDQSTNFANFRCYWKSSTSSLKKNIIGRKNSTTGSIYTGQNVTDRFHDIHIYEILMDFRWISMDFRDFSDLWDKTDLPWLTQYECLSYIIYTKSSASMPVNKELKADLYGIALKVCQWDKVDLLWICQ